jgi:hypothetical protein
MCATPPRPQQSPPATAATGKQPRGAVRGACRRLGAGPAEGLQYARPGPGHEQKSCLQTVPDCR